MGMAERGGKRRVFLGGGEEWLREGEEKAECHDYDYDYSV